MPPKKAILHNITCLMVALIIIVVALVLQLVGYVQMDKHNYVRRGKLYILLVALACHLVLFPMIIINLVHPSGPRCAMPDMAAIVVFWILGAVPTLLEYWIYQLLRRKPKEAD